MKPLDIVDIRNAMKSGDIWFVKDINKIGNKPEEEKIYVENGAGERVLIEIKYTTGGTV